MSKSGIKKPVWEKPALYLFTIFCICMFWLCEKLYKVLLLACLLIAVCFTAGSQIVPGPLTVHNVTALVVLCISIAALFIVVLMMQIYYDMGKTKRDSLKQDVFNHFKGV